MQSSADQNLHSNQTRVSTNHYGYYNATGDLLGETTGPKPDDTLFQTAHYVIANQEDMLKNQDSQSQIRADIASCEAALLKTSVSNMGEILYLNRLIKALKQFLLDHHQAVA